jgi:hypothetical protein
MAGVLIETCSLAILLSSTLTTFRATGCEVVRTWVEVAVTAPGTRWFTYFTFVTVVLLLTTFVL